MLFFFFRLFLFLTIPNLGLVVQNLLWWTVLQETCAFLFCSVYVPLIFVNYVNFRGLFIYILPQIALCMWNFWRQFYQCVVKLKLSQIRACWDGMFSEHSEHCDVHKQVEFKDPLIIGKLIDQVYGLWVVFWWISHIIGGFTLERSHCVVCTKQKFNYQNANDNYFRCPIFYLRVLLSLF